MNGKERAMTMVSSSLVSSNDAHGWQIHLADTPETAFIIQIPTKS
jgi:hypothetical protein